MENRKEEYCPICNTIVTNINRSTVQINNESVCRSCMRSINRIIEGKKISKKTNIEDLQKMVEKEKKSTFITSIIAAVVLFLLVLLILYWFVWRDEEEYRCQTEEECAEERIWDIVDKSDN